ncbi:hypothetical protein AGMMS49944_13560 [Spirochaetia bacterium]|nr:hypothetical protein AGMMS49944_13560 [Spirochaetia bacterium]
MRDKIKEAMKRTFKLTEVVENISPATCAAWDSLNHLNLIFELETEFNVSFSPEDFVEMKTLNDIENKLKSLIN